MTKYQKGTSNLIKNINIANVLDVIKKLQPISRIKISKILNMSKSTVSTIVDELINTKLVNEVGYGKSSTAGRKPIELIFNPDAKYSVGIDMESTNTIGVLTNLNGKIIKKLKRKTGVKDGAFRTCINMIYELIDGYENIIGVGIGTPGINDIKKGLVYAPGLEWNQYPILKKLQDKLNYDIYIDNSVNYAALGERWIGSCIDTNDFALITIGRGIGSGIYVNGKLVRGYNYAAGEVGYMAINEDVFKKRYLYEDYGYFDCRASLSGLYKFANGFSNDHKYTTIKEIFDGYKNNDKVCIKSVNEFIKNLSMGIANIVCILNPELIIIGGDIINYNFDITTMIKKLVDKIVPFETKIICAKLKEDAAAIGASANVLLKTNYLVLL